MNFDLESLITERIRKAKETLDVAKLLASENHWNSTANRLYYSAFYACPFRFTPSLARR